MSTDLLQGIFNVITQIQLQWLPGHKTPTKLHLSCFIGVAALEVCTGKQNLNQRRESVFGANVIATAKRNKIKQKVSF